MNNALLTFALLLLTQLFLLLVSQNGNIMTSSEIVVVTLILMLFIGLFFAGMRWARWVAVVLLALLAFLFVALTFEGDGVGLLSVAILYIAVMLALFRSKRSRGKSGIGSDEAILDSAFIGTTPERQTMPDLQPGIAEGFSVDGEVYRYPLLLKRYQSVLIDVVLLFSVMVLTMVIMGNSESRQTVMVTLGVLVVLVYEPLLTSYSATLGQYIMGIRVRDMRNPRERIGIIQAYARLIVKWFLGWLSFVTINFNRQHRAIHDFAGSSVVISVTK